MKNRQLLLSVIMLLIAINASAQIDGVQKWRAAEAKTCISGNCENGEGKIDFSGTFQFATSSMSQGSRVEASYEGGFENSVPSGRGTLIYKDYSGSYPNDSIVVTGDFLGLVSSGKMQLYSLVGGVLIMEGEGSFFFREPIGSATVTFYKFATITPNQDGWSDLLSDRCTGKIVYTNGAEFRGEVQDFHAFKGTYTTSHLTASIQVDEYRNIGAGTVNYTNGDKFSGRFKLPLHDYDNAFSAYTVGNKTLQLMSGTMEYGDGRKYTGNFDPVTGKPKNPENIIAVEKTEEEKASELSISTSYAEATKLIDDGRLDQAFAIAEKVLNDNRQNQQANVIAAKIFSEGGDNRKACMILRNARTLGSEGADEIVKMMRDVCRR
ncbi:MAG: hypothetical protein RIF33_02150 [Cyclobacteriaceae bacterium]